MAPRSLAARAIGFEVSREAIPLFVLYALLFRDRGLSNSEIGVLIVVWSAVAFVLEVPSGAWADLVDRRRLLLLSAVLYIGCFASWAVAPHFAGFLVGFVLWGISSALRSGTFESLVYDALVESGSVDRYGPLRATIETASVLAVLVSAVAAAPLFDRGGYGLVAGVSVAVALVHVLVTATLPSPPRSGVEPDEAGVDPDPVVAEHPVGSGALPRRYLATLRVGAGEAARSRPVRRTILALAAVVTLVALDEYMALLFAEDGARVTEVAWIGAGVVALQALGTAAAAVTARSGPGALALAGGLGALGIGAGAWFGGGWGYALVGLGYAAATNGYVAAQIRLQETMTGRTRATVTSVSGLATEAAAITSFGLVAAGTARWSLAAVMAGFCLPFGIASVVTAARVVDPDPDPDAEPAPGPEPDQGGDVGPRPSTERPGPVVA